MLPIDQEQPGSCIIAAGSNLKGIGPSRAHLSLLPYLPYFNAMATRADLSIHSERLARRQSIVLQLGNVVRVAWQMWRILQTSPPFPAANDSEPAATLQNSRELAP
jgi:hypothetical protein